MLRLLVIGDDEVGKTSWIVRAASDRWSTNFVQIPNNVSAVFQFQNHVINVTFDEVQTWELSRVDFQRYDGIMVMYDVTKPYSFDVATQLINSIIEHRSKIYLLGNKADRNFERQVRGLAVRDFCQRLSISHTETSARTKFHTYKPLNHFIEKKFGFRNVDVFENNVEQLEDVPTDIMVE